MLAAFLLGNAAAGFWLWRWGLQPGQALGIVALFYLFALPCGILSACFVAPFAGGVPALLVAVVLAAWLAWASVLHTGTAVELIDPAGACHDRQGAYHC